MICRNYILQTTLYLAFMVEEPKSCNLFSYSIIYVL